MGLIPMIDPPCKTVQERGLKKIRTRHRVIAHMLVEGKRNKDIIRELGISRQWLSTIIYSPMFQEELRKLGDERDKLLLSF